MNPMTNIKNTQKISDREIDLGTAGTKNSWHNRYKDSAWIFIGGLPYDLTEGDVICVFSQCGEIVNCNMVRDQKTGKSKGFMFICYEDQRSTVLAVDNLNGIKLLKRTIRVDHVLDYKPPKDHDNDHDLTRQLRNEGCAPKAQSSEEEDDDDLLLDLPVKKEKKAKKKKKEKKKRKSRSPSESPGRKSVKQEVVVKKEKFDPGYRDMDPEDIRNGRHGNGEHSNRRHRDGTDRHEDDRRHSHRDDKSHRLRESSPRRRSPSPRQRERLPRDRSRSPRRREPSPRRRDPSPRRRSPKTHDPSPRKRSRSPRRRSRSRDRYRY